MLFTNRVMTFMMPGMIDDNEYCLTVGIVWFGAVKSIDGGTYAGRCYDCIYNICDDDSHVIPYAYE